MGNPFRTWPLGLRLAWLGIALAGVVAIIQDVGLASRRPVSVFEIWYATLVTFAYVLGVAFGFSGRRRAFFWNAFAVVALHSMFFVRYGWFLLSIVREFRINPLRLIGRYDAWNFGLLGLTILLASYLVAVERPRLFRLPVLEGE